MRAYARLLPAVALTLALQAGPRPADAADNSADPEGPGVGPQYDGAHVYLAPSDMEPFIKSFIATFGGQAGAPASTTVTPRAARALRWCGRPSARSLCSHSRRQSPIPSARNGSAS